MSRLHRHCSSPVTFIRKIRSPSILWQHLNIWLVTNHGRHPYPHPALLSLPKSKQKVMKCFHTVLLGNINNTIFNNNITETFNYTQAVMCYWILINKLTYTLIFLSRKTISLLLSFVLHSSVCTLEMVTYVCAFFSHQCSCQKNWTIASLCTCLFWICLIIFKVPNSIIFWLAYMTNNFLKITHIC